LEIVGFPFFPGLITAILTSPITIYIFTQPLPLQTRHFPCIVMPLPSQYPHFLVAILYHPLSYNYIMETPKCMRTGKSIILTNNITLSRA
jgi:hypothetical protein